jgi:LmbE family N-acetylglucosaminyl deacetylase
VTWVVFSASGAREEEARASAAGFLNAAGSIAVSIHRFRESYFPAVVADIKDVFEGLKMAIEPDLVITHRRTDRHQDHRTIADLTWNTFRDHLILEYEIPKYDGDLGTPNVFVPLSDDVAADKLRLLVEHHLSQSDKHWFDEELFRGLMRIRGMESATRYAEAFTCRKLSLLPA